MVFVGSLVTYIIGAEISKSYGFDLFDPFDTRYSEIHPIAHPISMYGWVYVYILFNVYWVVRGYRSTVQRIVALSEGLPLTPREATLPSPRVLPRTMGNPQNFSPKIISIK